MEVKGLVRIVAALMLVSNSVIAGQQVGVYGLQSFTDKQRVPSPAGVGAFVQKDLSTKVSLRFSLQKGFDSDNYVKTIRYGGPFSQPGDTIRDFWHQKSSMSAYDVAVLFRPFGQGKLNLSIGGSLGIVNLGFKAVGRSSNYEMIDDSNFRMAYSGLLDFEVAPLERSPLLFHITIRERIAPDNRAYPTDGIYYLAGSISSAEIAFAVGLGF